MGHSVGGEKHMINIFMKSLIKKIIPIEFRILYRHFAKQPRTILKYFIKKKEYLKDKERHLPPKAFKYYLSIGAIIYNEAEYIIEWIEYHRLVGVQKFYIYDNESSDNVKELLKPYIDNNIVEYFFINGKHIELYKAKTPKDYYTERNRFSQTIQWPAYNAIIHHAKYHTFWLAFIDIDEFIVPISTEKITDFLKNFENEAGIEINWLMYGHSGHITKTNHFVIERFKHHSQFGLKENTQRKVVVNPRHVFQQRIHTAVLFEGKQFVDSDGKTAHHINGYTPKHDKIRINHYLTKSFEEWCIRRKGIKYTVFNNLNLNDEFNELQKELNIVTDDKVMEKYIKPLGSIIHKHE